MNETKELIGYALREIKSIVPPEVECRIEYVMSDKREEAVFFLADKTYQDKLDFFVKYLLGVRDSFMFMNDYKINNIGK